MHRGRTPRGSIGLRSNLYPCGPGRVRRPMRKQINRLHRDVDGRYRVGVATIAAGDTSEVGLRGTIGSSGLTTFGTGAAGAFGIDEQYRDADLGSFVLGLVNQVSEGPRGEHPVEPLRAGDSVPDPVKPLKGDYGVGVLRGKVNEFAAGLVVDVGHPTSFLALGAFDSIHASMPLIPFANDRKVFSSVSDLLSVPNFDAVGSLGCHQPDDSQIYADNRRVAVTDGRRVGCSEREHDEPGVVSLEELGVALNVLKTVAPLLRDAEGQPEIRTALAGGHTEDLINDCISVDAQPYRRTREDGVSGTSFRFSKPKVGPSVLGSVVDRHARVVGGKAEVAAPSIGGSMDRASVDGLVCEGEVESEARALEKKRSHILQPRTLAGRRSSEFENNGFLHGHKYNPWKDLCQQQIKERQFLPRLKLWASLPNGS